MSQQVKDNSGEPFWRLFVAAIIFYVIFSALRVWLSEPAAALIAIFGFMLVSYRFASKRKVGFFKWALSSLCLSLVFVDFSYVMPSAFCGRLGPVLTGSLMGIFLALCSLAPRVFTRRGAGDRLWKWVALGAGLVAFFALYGYINPGGVCQV